MADAPQKKKLRRLQFDEVSMVAEGGNPLTDIVFYKSAPRSEPAQETKEMVFDINTIPEPFRKSVQDELARRDQELELAKATPKVSEVVPPAVKPPELDIPEPIAKAMNVQRDEILDLRKRLEQKEEAEYVTFAKSEFPNIQDIDKLAVSLFKLSKTDKTLADDLRRALKSAQEIAKSAAGILTEERGASKAPVGTGAYAKAEAIAKSKLVGQADQGPVAFAKALTATFHENPSLYDEYQAEKKAR